MFISMYIGPVFTVWRICA